MNLFTVVVKDILRRKSKFLLAVFGVVIAISAFVAITTIFSAAESGLYDETAKYGANIIMKPHTDNIPLFAGSTTVGSLSTGNNYINESDISKIWTIENKTNIAVVAPKLYGIVETNGTNAVLLGINTSEEAHLKPWWKPEGHWPDPGEVMVGADIARIMGLKSGSSIEIIGSETGQFTVSGVLRATGAAEDTFIIARLSDAQFILDRPGLVSSVEIRALCNNCPVDVMSRQLEAKIPGIEARAISQIVMGEMALIDRTRSAAMAVTLVTLLVSAMTVASTMLAAINEKTKEIGIMRAVGATDGQIMAMVMLEGGITGVAGGLTGFAVGSSAAVLFGSILIDYSPYPLYDLLPRAVALSTLIGMAAAYIPARRALNINPVEVLRDV